jgi:signal transduction histidine kinase/Tfp pilus assembly protein PilF
MKKNSYIILFSFLVAFLYVVEGYTNNNEADPKVSTVLIDSINTMSYKNRRSDPKLSLEFAIKAFELCSQIDYPKGLAAALHNRGTAKSILGRFDLGLMDLIEASKIREEIKDHQGLISSFNNIGFVFSEMGNDKKALEYYEKSIEYQQKTNFKRDIGIVLNNIGWVHFRDGKYDVALTYFYKALTANQEDGDERGIGASKSNIGTIYRHMGEYQKGLDFHNQAFENGKTHNDRLGMISTLREISEDYLAMNQDEKATSYAQHSLTLAQEIGSLGEEKNSYILLARIYEKRGKFKEASQQFKKISQLKDSLFSIEKAEVFGRMQAIYELESSAQENKFLLKEQENNAQTIRMQKYLLWLSFTFIVIAIASLLFIFSINRKVKIANNQLKKKNLEIEAQKEITHQKAYALDDKNKELQQINQIKDKLISVIAHDLKNPFNNISGYSEILISQLDTYSKNELLSFLRIIYDSSIKGNMLLDNLLQWSRLQTNTLQFLPIKHNLYNLVTDELFFVQHIALERVIKINNNIPNDLQIVADSNMLKTVIRNLISNAIKFTGTNGTITLSAEKSNDGVNIIIEDTGKGIDPQIKAKLFTGEAGVTTANESGEKGTGLGLMLCKDFIDMHNGKIWVESEPKNGAKFYINLPTNSQN